MLSEEIYYYKIKFTDIYQHAVLPALRIVENDRKKWVNSALIFKQRGVVFIAILCIFLNFYAASKVEIKSNIAAPTVLDNVVSIWMTPEVLLFLAIVSLLGGIACFVASFLCKTKFDEKLKSKVMPVVVKAYDTLKWSNSPIIPVGEIVASKLFDYINFSEVKACNGDSFIGSFKNHTFKISEVTLKSNKNDSSEFFKGIIISVEISRRILGNTLVKSKNSKIKTEYEKILLFDEFSNNFDVMSTDKLEGRYLASDRFLRYIQDLKKLCGAENVECSFFEHRLLISLPTDKTLFFVGDFDNSILETEQYTKFLDQLVCLFELILALKIY